MKIVNRVQLTGNLGSDPEIKTFENGNKLARFSMATNEEYISKNGEKNNGVHWHFVIAWGQLAEKIEAELKKGVFVSVEGRLNTRNYTAKDGTKKYVTEVVAQDFQVTKRS